MERKDVCPARQRSILGRGCPHSLADWKSPSVVNRRPAMKKRQDSVPVLCPLGLQFLRKLLTFLCCSGDVAA